MGLYAIQADGVNVRITETDDKHLHAIAGGPASTVARARAAAWGSLGVRADGRGRYRGDAKTGRHNREIIQKVINADARPEELSEGVRLLGQANTLAQQILCSQWVDSTVRQIVTDHGINGAAKIAADAANAHGIKTDASILGSAGAIKENMTLWAYRVFTQRPNVLHYRDMFVVDDGLDPFNLSIQLLFSLRTGEAKFWDGSAGGNHRIGGLQFREERLEIHNLIASDEIGYIESGRLGLMGTDAMASSRAGLGEAIELVHDRLAFQGSSDASKIKGLKNYPVAAVASGYSLATVTDAQLLDVLTTAVRKPTERSKEKYFVNRLMVSNQIMTRMKKITPTSAMGKSVLAMFREANPEIEIAEAHELGGLYGTGIHAIVGLPRDPGVAPTYLRAPTLFLPEVQNGVSTVLHAVSATAGMYAESPVGITVRTLTA